MQRLQDLIVVVVMCSAFLLVPIQGLSDSGSKAPDSIPLFASFIEKDKAVLADEHALSDTPMGSSATGASRIAQVTINQAAIDAATIARGDILAINLFDDESIEATIDKVEVSNKTTTIRGEIKGSDYGHIITTVYENKVLTVIELPAEGYQYKIVYDNDAKTHFLYKTKLSELDKLEGGPSLTPPDQGNDSSSLSDTNAAMVAADTAATIDILVVYTPAAASWASANAGNINLVISQAMTKAQLALENSNTLMNMRLVHSGQVAYTESGNSITDLNRLTSANDGYMDQVHALRDQYGADLVALFATVEDVGGVGWLLQQKSGDPDYAFCLVRVQQAGWTFTHIHEMGHNMGAHHHKQQNFQPGPTRWNDWSENTWSAGWRWVGSANYCSIMTYEAGDYFTDGQDHSRVAYFSNPSISYQGQATGNSANGDNARTLREIRNVIAAYRIGSCTTDADCGGWVCLDTVCVECIRDDNCTGDDVCSDNVCVECAVDGDCDDDALYCTGPPVCTGGVCGFEPDHCGVDAPFCDETNRRCAECLENSGCDDTLFCTGVETCVDGACIDGTEPCTGEISTPFCDEAEDLCVECLDAGDCADDSLYCTGAPVCIDGACAFESDPCEGDTPFCDETNKRCAECLENSACADDLFCTGPHMCTDGVCEFEPGPCEGETPACDEDNDQCEECLEDSHCETFFSCENNECVPFPVTSPFTTVTLKGPGMMNVIFYPNRWDIAWIQLTGTTEDSSLTIIRKLKNFDVILDGLDVVGSLKSIKGKNVVLTDTLTATGGIGKMHLFGTESGSTINVPWIGTLLVTGYFDGDMTLTGAGSPPKGLTLGKASIKGWLRNSQWLINGNVGSVKVDLWGAGSILAASVDPGTDGQFFTSDDVATGGWLEKLDYKYYETDNKGAKFGVIADKILDTKAVFLEAGDFYIREIQ